MNRTRRHPTHIVLAALAGCGGDAERPVVYTEHLEVELYDSDVICQGSLEDMEAQVSRLMDILDVELPAPIVLHYGYAAVDAHCASKHIGCAKTSQYVAASESSLYHELVHAVRAPDSVVGTGFFEEGISEVLSGFRPRPYAVSVEASEVERGPEILARLPRRELTAHDYATAGHFMSWLRIEFSDETLVSFLNSEEYTTTEAVESAFLDHFGLSLEEADSAWRTTSFEEYTWGDLCDPARALTWNGSSLELKGGVDCTQPDTIGPSYDGGITTRSHCFTLEEPGLVRVELSATAPRATATFRQFGCARDEQLDFEYYDLRIVKEGEPRDLPMGACTWEISVTRRGLILESRTPVEPMEFTLRLSKL